MFCKPSIVLHLARGIVAIVLIASLFLLNLHPIIAIIFFIGAILLLRGCPVCWFISLFNQLTDKCSKNTIQRGSK